MYKKHHVHSHKVCESCWFRLQQPICRYHRDTTAKIGEYTSEFFMYQCISLIQTQVEKDGTRCPSSYSGAPSCRPSVGSENRQLGPVERIGSKPLTMRSDPTWRNGDSERSGSESWRIQSQVGQEFGNPEVEWCCPSKKKERESFQEISFLIF